METARRMWGGNYEIVVTTHLNTDNIHNHFVINSVSFKTGRKFENHISDHYRLREISERDMTEINELTPTLVNSLIERIEVHNNDKSSGHCYVKVDIYFSAVGMIDIPIENEILATMEEIRENPQNFRFVA